MRKSTRSLAEELNSNAVTVSKMRKRFDTEEEVVDNIKLNQQIKGRNSSKTRAIEDGLKRFKLSVRRIDQSNTSSLRDVLQDCKERYVRNEEIIQRLQYEADQFDAYTVDNANGSLSMIPALQGIERFTKLNISLRTQIIALEQALEISAEDEADPFG